MNDVEQGPISKADIFKKDLNSNSVTTNIIRVLCFILIVAGIGLLFSPIIELLNFIPLIGSFIAVGFAFAIWIAAFIVGTLIFCLTVGLAWLVYRPKIGIPLLLIVVAIILVACFA